MTANETAIQQEVIAEFQKQFGAQPLYIARAPGRVNLIGEHTDYNDGFVLPMAIDRAVWIALQPREDRLICAYPLDFRSEARVEFSLNNITKGKPSPAEYLKGIAWSMQAAGFTLKGWEGVIKGDVPIGAGLSSSAALEMATAQAFCAVSDIAWYAPAMAKLGQKAENEWIGVNSGIMDQMISASGKLDQALLIDCRSLETALAPLPKGTAVIVLDTSTRRELVDSAYNERRAQCEAAAAFFGVSALRDVTLEQFEARASELDGIIRKRARHVITENQRVLQSREAMLRDDPMRLGKLMNASHESMRDDFEISSEALNAMVECARQHPACYGARMTGGGFAGCAVALIRDDAVEDFVATVTQCYQNATRHTAQIYITEPSAGAEIFVETQTQQIIAPNTEIRDDDETGQG